MLDTNLTSVSTQGWFTDVTVEEKLLPVATLGWWLDEIPEKELADAFELLLLVNRLLSLELTR